MPLGKNQVAMGKDICHRRDFDSGQTIAKRASCYSIAHVRTDHKWLNCAQSVHSRMARCPYFSSQRQCSNAFDWADLSSTTGWAAPRRTTRRAQQVLRGVRFGPLDIGSTWRSNCTGSFVQEPTARAPRRSHLERLRPHRSSGWRNQRRIRWPAAAQAPPPRRALPSWALGHVPAQQLCWR